MADLRQSLPLLAAESRSQKLPRAWFVYATMASEFNCAGQMSGIGGLTLTELHTASGYPFNGDWSDHPFDK
jgi:hypothetical protein